jgi:hypothetical protein
MTLSNCFELLVGVTYGELLNPGQLLLLSKPPVTREEDAGFSLNSFGSKYIISDGEQPGNEQ